jgi:hypothetical protein
MAAHCSLAQSQCTHTAHTDSAAQQGLEEPTHGCPLAELPPPLLAHVAERCLERHGVTALAALSCTCRALLAACDAALGGQTRLAHAATSALRRAVAPDRERAAALMRRLLGALGGVVALDLAGLFSFVHDDALAVGLCPRGAPVL